MNVTVTQGDVHAAALQWCGEKDRETSLDDVRYFENNWQSLPGLRSRVEAFARHRTAAEAAFCAREARLREVIERAQQIILHETYVNWHAATRAALTASEGGEA